MEEERVSECDFGKALATVLALLVLIVILFGPFRFRKEDDEE